MQRRRAERPDWHMRSPFLIALLVTAAALSLADWRVGPLLLALLIVRYLFAKLTLGTWP